MVTGILFIPSTDPNKNKRVVNYLERLQAKGVSVKGVLGVSKFWEDIAETPLVETNEGDRYFGVKDISQFLKQELSEKK